jgi:RHS repeat-associated protein
MVNDFEVIHMGGRTYNPILGRFMQADPFVQAPGNLQNYNRYSYVLNNPMSYTDPSGYIFKKINKALGKFASVFGIALMFIPGMQAWAAQSLLHAAATGFLVGGVSTGSLRGAMVGALTGAAFHQIGSHFGSKFGDFSSATLGQQAQWAGSHALAGGISSSLSGGKFGHGFFSAGFTKFAMGNAGFNYSNQSSSAVAGRVLIAAMIGGTASVISGGKFKNGATTAAMAQLLNAETENNRNSKKIGAPITESQQAMLDDEDFISFWKSRHFDSKDPVARTALIGWGQGGLLGDMSTPETWAASYTWNRLESFIMGNRLPVTMNQLGIELARAHADFVMRDTQSVPYLLSPKQVSGYHHEVFDRHAIPRSYFGGTRTGNSLINNLYRSTWCSGCDKSP